MKPHGENGTHYRVLGRPEVVDLCRVRLREMEAENFWGPTMKDAPATAKCVWMLRHLHIVLRLQCRTFDLNEAVGWADEIVAAQGEPTNEA